MPAAAGSRLPVPKGRIVESPKTEGNVDLNYPEQIDASQRKTPSDTERNHRNHAEILSGQPA